ncbi:hypothetical protein DFQ27_002526 [Actinomortierella ambigua]|uniref:Major facilitator superfamily (MFS) profile domain-containing protein n=1 Tax=Actinomortierella ambigua TaxID=1343610 RepID=A0A9P6Q7D7_9FUNG|nr:hypothetical protein DFQ27_002526 [Actinomortierella ambigua]
MNDMEKMGIPQKEELSNNSSFIDHKAEVVSNNDLESFSSGKDASVNVDAPVGPKEVVTLPFKQLMLVFVGLCLGVFLSSLDQTIVSVCTKEIANQFNSMKEIPWIGTAYLLTSTAFQPLYGRFSDIFGRKPTFLFAIGIFLVGSALCGAAQSMVMLIVARGIAGVGAGGIFSSVMIILTDIISLRDRGRYQGIIGAVFGVSSVVGPLLGGVFTDHASWRWAFYINLPIGAITLVAVIKLLHLPHVGGSMKEKLLRIDFLGSLTLIVGLVMILLPLNWGGSTYAWNDPLIIGLFCGGFAILGLFCLVEWKQAVEPIIPFHLFKDRTNNAVFVCSLFIGCGMFGMMFFIPIYFQVVKGESATAAGLETIPLIVGLLLSSISSGIMVAKWGQIRPFIWIGLALSTVGCGLLGLLKESSSRGATIGILFVPGLGIGMCMQTIMLAIQSSVGPADIAVATAVATFFRTVGSVLGVAICGTVFNNKLKDSLAGLIAQNPSIVAVISNSDLAGQWGPEIKQQILDSYMDALHLAFLINVPFMAVALLASLFIRHIKLRKAGPAPPPME